MPSESVDLILTDPPYGIRSRTQHRYVHFLPTDRGIANDGDNIAMLTRVVEQTWRVLRPDRHFYWFTRWDRLPEHIRLIRRLFQIKNILIWAKGGFSHGDLRGAYASTYETIIFAQKGRRVLQPIGDMHRHGDLISVPKVPSLQLLHAHQKPLPILQFLVQKSTFPAETVLDPFAGSGSTLVASLQLGRKAIGVELSVHYAAVTARRILETGQAVQIRLASREEGEPT